MPVATEKILVTGACGFVGSHVVRKMLAEGYEVAITKRNSSDTRRIADLKKNIISYDVNIENFSEVAKVVQSFKPSAVVHLAAFYAVNHTPDQIPCLVDSNVLGTINFLEALRSVPDAMFINASTFFVYDHSNEALKEVSKIKPFNLYALTKKQAEDACLFYADRYGLRSVTFRMFAPYGPFDHDRRLIPYLIENFIKGEKPKMTLGNQQWDFVYIEDIADAYCKLLKAGQFTNTYEVFNIGTGEVVSVRDIALRLKEIFNSDNEPSWGAIPERPGELKFVKADIKKAENMIGWKPRTRIMEDGLVNTTRWFDNYFTKVR